MAPSKGIPLLDAATLLVGWSNRSASRGHDKVFVSGEVVQLSTKLDASNRFSLIAAHPGHSQAVTVLLEVAPKLRDGRAGSFVSVASVAIPAEGGRVEAHINGQDIQLDPADVANADPPALCFARAIVSPSTPEGMTVGLTATLPA
jgi:hypothetical protein